MDQHHPNHPSSVLATPGHALRPQPEPLPCSRAFSLKVGLRRWRWFGWGQGLEELSCPLTQPYPSLVKVRLPPSDMRADGQRGPSFKLGGVGLMDIFKLSKPRFATLALPSTLLPPAVYTPPPSSCARFPGIPVKERADIWARVWPPFSGFAAPPPPSTHALGSFRAGNLKW